MKAEASDAIVFFGATGDLAYKQIFPALLGLVRDEGVDVPIIGVAKSGWSLEQFQARAKDSLSHHGGYDEAAFAKLISLLRYVDGDYADPQTFASVKQALGPARRPTALSGHSSSPFWRRRRRARPSGAQRRRPAGRRKAVRARPEFGAGSQQDFARTLPRGGDFPHRSLSGQGAGAEHCLYAFCQSDVRADLEPPFRAQHPDHHGGGFRRRGSRKLLRRDRRYPRRGAEPHAAGAGQSDDGPADRRGARGDRAIRRQAC